MPAKYELNEKDYAKIEDLASKGCSSQIIADQLGVDRATFYRHMIKNNEIKRHYKKGIADVVAQVCGKLIENCIKGDNASIFFYLKTRCNFVEGDKSGAVIKKIIEYIRSHHEKLVDKELLTLARD